MLAKIKNKYFLYIMIGIILTMIVGIYATISTKKEVTNHLYMDTVDISLEEYMKIGEETQLFEIPDVVYPGSYVSFIPRIENKGVDAYIRIKVDISKMRNSDGTNEEDLKTLDFESIKGFDSDQWIYKNGYYYYVNVLKEYESIDIFKSIKIPYKWGNEYEDKKFDVDIVAEAIQAKNFTPNLESKNPWGDIVVEKTVRSRMNNKK